MTDPAPLDSAMTGTEVDRRAPPAGRDRRTLRGARLWGFRGLAMLLALLPFVLLEFGLRMLDVGHDPALILPIAQDEGMYQFNPEFDRPYYGATPLAGPEVRPFRLPKPERITRILVVGGSTVAGFPFPPELAFPRYMEVFLQAQAGPEETIEVLNAGITAIGSSTEVDVVRQGLATEPDLIVVYTGHNEFYGPGGVASSGGSLSPGWFRILARVRGWRSVQLFRAAFRTGTPGGPPQDLLEVLPRDVHIAADGPVFVTACDRLRANLMRMRALASARNVPILFVTPVANERDQPPLERFDVDQIAPLQIAGERQAFATFDRVPDSGETERFLRVLHRFQEAHPAHPLVAFRYAQALERSGDHAQAREFYQRALEADGCRFRAPQAFRDIVLNDLAPPDASPVSTLDLYPVLGGEETCGVPGRTTLLEHVHLSWEGNEVVGRALARQVWEQAGRAWQKSREPSRAELFERLGLLPEDLLAGYVLSAAVYQRTPFREGADAERLGKGLAQDAAAVYAALPPRRQALIDRISTAAMSHDLLGNLLSGATGPEDTELRRILLSAGTRRRPWMTVWRAELEASQRERTP